MKEGLPVLEIRSPQEKNKKFDCVKVMRNLRNKVPLV
jgi:hypothetical protein